MPRDPRTAYKSGPSLASARTGLSWVVAKVTKKSDVTSDKFLIWPLINEAMRVGHTGRILVKDFLSGNYWCLSPEKRLHGVGVILLELTVSGSTVEQNVKCIE